MRPLHDDMTSDERQCTDDNDVGGRCSNSYHRQCNHDHCNHDCHNEPPPITHKSTHRSTASSSYYCSPIANNNDDDQPHIAIHTIDQDQQQQQVIIERPRPPKNNDDDNNNLCHRKKKRRRPNFMTTTSTAAIMNQCIIFLFAIIIIGTTNARADRWVPVSWNDKDNAATSNNNNNKIKQVSWHQFTSAIGLNNNGNNGMRQTNENCATKLNKGQCQNSIYCVWTTNGQCVSIKVPDNEECTDQPWFYLGGGSTEENGLCARSNAYNPPFEKLYDTSLECCTANFGGDGDDNCSLLDTCGITEKPTGKPTSWSWSKNPTMKPTTDAPTTIEPTMRPTNKPTMKPTKEFVLQSTTQRRVQLLDNYMSNDDQPLYYNHVGSLSFVKSTSSETTSTRDIILSSSPSVQPSESPSYSPSVKPTLPPSRQPSKQPSKSPTPLPSAPPSKSPTDRPTSKPTESPSYSPTPEPTTAEPSYSPTNSPTVSARPTPLIWPSSSPTISSSPTDFPSVSPSALPSSSPTSSPTKAKAIEPVPNPTPLPTSKGEPNNSFEVVSSMVLYDMPYLLQYLDNAEETWIRVTTRRIKNEVASYIDNGLEVSIWLEGQALLPTEEEPTVRRRRRRRLQSQPSPAPAPLKVDFTTTIKFNSNAKVDQNDANNMVVGAFKTTTHQADYIKSLQDADSSSFDSVDRMTMKVDDKLITETDNSNELQPVPEKEMTIYYIIGVVACGGLLLMIVGGLIYKRRRRNNRGEFNPRKDKSLSTSSPNDQPSGTNSFGKSSIPSQPQQHPQQPQDAPVQLPAQNYFGTIQAPDGEDDVSTLGDPYFGEGCGPSEPRADETVAGQSMMSSEHEMHVFGVGRPRLNTGGESTMNQSTVFSASGGGGGTTTGRMVFGDDTTLEDVYRTNQSGLASFDEEEGSGESNLQKLVVVAPGGKLGIVIDNKTGDLPIVHAIKESSVLNGRLLVGDLLISVDELDCRGLSAVQVSRVISNRSRNPTRTLVVMRRSGGGAAC